MTGSHLFLLPGLGARTRDIREEGWELSQVRDVLMTHGKVTILTHLPDIEAHTRTCVDFNRVVVALVDEISARSEGDLPVIVGYSIGGYIAVELCRRLEQSGLPVQLLVLLDSSAVYIPSPGKPLKERIADALRKGRRSAIIEIPFLVALRSGALEPARHWLRVSRRLFGDDAVRWIRMELLVVYWLMIVGKTPVGSYEGRVLLLKARKGRPRILEPDLGWGAYLSNLMVVTVEGDHWSALRHADLLGQLDGVLAGLGARTS